MPWFILVGVVFRMLGLRYHHQHVQLLHRFALVVSGSYVSIDILYHCIDIPCFVGWGRGETCALSFDKTDVDIKGTGQVQSSDIPEYPG